MKNHRLTAIALLLLANATLGANALPITWELQDVIFMDGGTASGTFTVDVDTQSIFDVSITTTPGDDPLMFPGMTFSGESINANFITDGLMSVIFSTTDGTNEYSFGMLFITQMGFLSPLDNSGGSAFLLESESFEDVCELDGLNCYTRFTDIGGMVVSVPEPGLLGLLGAGCLAFGLSRAKRSRRLGIEKSV